MSKKSDPIIVRPLAAVEISKTVVPARDCHVAALLAIYTHEMHHYERKIALPRTGDGKFRFIGEVLFLVVGRGHALAGAGIIVFAENSHKNGTFYRRKGHALSLQNKYELTDKSEFVYHLKNKSS